MKLKYLPIEDRQNLRVLRHNKDKKLTVAILESMLRRLLTLQTLWEYRKWFLELDEETLNAHPSLLCGLVQIHVLGGNLSLAREWAEKLPEGSLYRCVTELMIPGNAPKDLVNTIKRISDEGWRIPNLSLTAGRISVMNGVWDLTPYTEYMQENREQMYGMIKALFPDGYDTIYDMIQAECRYQRNDCYGALVQVVGMIPFLKEKRDMRILFAALTLEIYVLVLNGQAGTTVPLMENLRRQMEHNRLEEYIPNIEALDAWAAMYDCDYARVTRWMKNDAPDEFTRFCMLDVFRYLVKMRAYIIQGKHLAVTSLAQRLLPLLIEGKRPMDTCELYVIWAMSDLADGREADAIGHMESAIELAEKYRYDRMIADEGKRALDVLRLYRRTHGENAYVDHLCQLAEKTASLHPGYLKGQVSGGDGLTEAELRVLRLLADVRTNAEIAETLGIAVDTVKQHCSHICKKLNVKNRHQAVQAGVELGILRKK